jgi:dTDP-4-dehydrorhamnose reductase
MFPVKVFITGAGGQVASALQNSAPAGVEVTALGHGQLDIADARAVAQAVAAVQPQVLINAAAYTAVDKAESDSAKAFKVNADGPGYLAEAAGRCGARYLHISTDFVFDGAQSHPYAPADAPRPLGVYAASKFAGERRVREVLGDEALILRTAWVYAAVGSNFVKTMLKLMRERGSIKVVSDQVGSPTWAASVATALWAAVGHPEVSGTLHWTDAGVASWYDFALAIAEEAASAGLLPYTPEVLPIGTAEYPTAARRPAYSVLACAGTARALGLQQAHWRVNLRRMLMELQNA